MYRRTVFFSVTVRDIDRLSVHSSQQSQVKLGTSESFLPERRYASAGYSDRNVSVRLSVRHAPVLCQNEES